MERMNAHRTAPRRVGILGGMGPAATVDLMKKILEATPAMRDQDHVPLIVWNVPQIPERLAALRGEGPSPLPAMIDGARNLETAGATALAIACNTAHHWAEELSAAVRVPILHIAEVAVAALSVRKPRPRSVGLLATHGTLASGFYQRGLERHDLRWILPRPAEQAGGVDSAIAFAKSGRYEEARAAFLRVARALLSRGADVLLLGCTELPLLSPGTDVEAQCLDPNSALARAIVRHSLGTHGPAATVFLGTQVA